MALWLGWLVLIVYTGWVAWFFWPRPASLDEFDGGISNPRNKDSGER